MWLNKEISVEPLSLKYVQDGQRQTQNNVTISEFQGNQKTKFFFFFQKTKY